MEFIYFYKLNQYAKKPTKAHKSDSGYDLYSTDNDVILHPNTRKLFHTGILVKLPRGYEAQIRSRSGRALKDGCIVLNSPGTIDSGYRGEICVILYNSGTKPIKITKQSKIAQMVIQQIPETEIFEGNYDDSFLRETDRGDDGFGSSGE